MDMSYDRSNFEARNFQQKIILEHLPLEYVLICTQLCMRNRDRFDIITRYFLVLGLFSEVFWIILIILFWI
eukprot:g82092.t1